MTLLIDNYDSFTYNLYQYIEELGYHCEVFRNDQISLQKIEELAPQRIVISPGPGCPDEAGISLQVIERFSGKIPIFGVCLGHQSIGQQFGGRVIRAKSLKHGKTSEIHHNNQGVFAGLPNPFVATRYHSLVVEADSLPKELEVTARTEDGLIMGLRHREYLTEGVQFHPESIATGNGKDLIGNFLKAAG